MRDRLSEALKVHDADFADIRLEDVTSTWVIFNGPDLDSIGSSRRVGGIVRALYKGGWGYSTFNDLENLEKRVRDACQTARLVGGEKSSFAEIEPVVDFVQAKMVKDFRQIPLAEKKALAEEYNQIVLRHHPKIQTSNVRYGDSFKNVTYASSEGTFIQEEQPDVYIYIAATAREGDIVQTAKVSGGNAFGYQSVENFQEQAAETAGRAVELVAAQPVAGGKYTVITDSCMTGVFIHEAFGHLSESDFIYENERMKELMKLGTRFGVDSLNAIDDGTLDKGLGTHRYDYEGVPMQETYLIKDGILVGRLHSRETAGKMGEKPTGNSRAVEFQHPPIVRMTNTYIDKGKDSFEDMISDIGLGVYAVDYFGGNTAMEMFTFSAAYGYMIRDGKLAEMVRDVVLTGNVFDTLMNIDGISQEVGWAPSGPGGCGKGEQYPLRVGLGGPYVRIKNCVVGGQQ